MISGFYRKKHTRKNLLFLLFSILLSLFLLITFPGCRNTINYFDYVSELRSNIFLVKTDDFSLRVYAVVKESPYSTDGIPHETFSRTEVYLIAPEGNKETYVTLQIEEKVHNGEMSYDVIKGEYYFACSADVSSCKSIRCKIQYGDEEIELTVPSVLTENTITPQNALEKLRREREDVFSSLTDKYGFAGEIYLRLLFEGSPYYYIGIIDRNGNCNAFLMNAETGKILAHRQS